MLFNSIEFLFIFLPVTFFVYFLLNKLKLVNLATGWLQTASGWYYMLDSGEMGTGWVNDKGTWYYMNKSGQMTTGWVESNNKWYYMKKNGQMATGWLNPEGTNFWYFMKDNGEMGVGWVHDGSNWYNMNKNGLLNIGWLQDGDKWYYLKSSGAMVWNDWQSINGYWYHFDKSGVMQTGKFTDTDGTTYDLGTSGGIADPMGQKANAYSSATNYLILVNRSSHMVYIFQGKQGSWQTIKSFQCTDGVATPNGTFTIGSHVQHFGEEKGYTCWYARTITGDILFHSVLYYPNTFNLQDGQRR